MIRVYTAADPADARMLCDLLNDNGVRAVVQGEALWGARGEIPMGPTTAPSVWIEEADVERARVLIADYESRPAAHSPSWKCPNCGERVGGQFSQCWKCGAQREPA
jgi:hypothetical protein